MQYFFNETTVMLNYINEEMREALPRTDSRVRDDVRLYEEGHTDEADAEKLKIEEQQRRVRRLIEEGKVDKWKPNFFREVPHPYLNSKEDLNTGEADNKPIRFELITGESGYWERRARGDWSGLPNIFGPFDEES